MKNSSLEILHEAIGQHYDVGSFEDFRQRLWKSQNRKYLYEKLKPAYELSDYGTFDADVYGALEQSLPPGLLEIINDQGGPRQVPEELILEDLLKKQKPIQPPTASLRKQKEQDSLYKTDFVPVPAPKDEIGVDEINNTILSYALKNIGRPYQYGAKSKSGAIDCSGLTSQIQKQLSEMIGGEFNLSDYSAAGQLSASTPIPISNVRPGDLLGMDKDVRKGRGRKGIDHIGIVFSNKNGELNILESRGSDVGQVRTIPLSDFLSGAKTAKANVYAGRPSFLNQLIMSPSSNKNIKLLFPSE